MFLFCVYNVRLDNSIQTDRFLFASILLPFCIFIYFLHLSLPHQKGSILILPWHKPWRNHITILIIFHIMVATLGPLPEMKISYRLVEIIYDIQKSNRLMEYTKSLLYNFSWLQFEYAFVLLFQTQVYAVVALASVYFILFSIPVERKWIENQFGICIKTWLLCRFRYRRFFPFIRLSRACALFVFIVLINKYEMLLIEAQT